MNANVIFHKLINQLNQLAIEKQSQGTVYVDLENAEGEYIALMLKPTAKKDNYLVSSGIVIPQQNEWLWLKVGDKYAIFNQSVNINNKHFKKAIESLVINQSKFEQVINKLVN